MTKYRLGCSVASVLLVSALVAGCSSKKPSLAESPKPPEAPRATKAAPPTPPLPSPEKPPMSDEEAWFHSASLADLQAKLQDIFFAYDRSELGMEARSAVDQNLEWLLRPYNTLTVEVEGHCDERGTPEYNLSLGHRRSGTVASYLLSMGFPEARLRTVSYGKERPLCSDAREACWWRNRRAHFRVLGREARKSDE